MTNATKCAEVVLLLDRAVDDELSASERAALDAHAATCADCAERVQHYTELSRMIRNGLESYAAPDMLKARIHGALRDEASAPRRATPAPTTKSTRRWAIAASIAVLLVSNVITFAIARRSAGEPRPSDILASHMRSLAPGHLVDVASNNTHNVKPWFNGRAAMSPLVPFLDSLDFHLVGGRMDSVDGRAATVVVYSRRLHMINIYAWPETGTDENESTRTERGYHLISWRRDGIRYWVASDLNLGELQDFVKAYRAS